MDYEKEIHRQSEVVAALLGFNEIYLGMKRSTAHARG